MQGLWCYMHLLLLLCGSVIKNASAAFRSIYGWRVVGCAPTPLLCPGIVRYATVCCSTARVHYLLVNEPLQTAYLKIFHKRWAYRGLNQW